MSTIWNEADYSSMRADSLECDIVMAVGCSDAQAVIWLVVFVQPLESRGPGPVLDGRPMQEDHGATERRNPDRVQQHKQDAKPEVRGVKVSAGGVEGFTALVVEVGHDVCYFVTVHISADREAVEDGEDVGADRRV